MQTVWAELQKRWGRYESIPIAIALLCVLYFVIIKYLEDLEGLTYLPKHRWIIAFGLVVILLFYIALCVKSYSLPQAPKGCLGVLFVIEAETEAVFSRVKYNLVSTFSELVDIDDAAPFYAVCVQKSKFEKYHFKKKKDVDKALQESKCIFLVSVRMLGNDTSSSENYEMHVFYDVLDPNLGSEREDVLVQAVKSIRSQIESQSFVRERSICVFTTTAQTLSYGCQYVLGLVYLLSDDYESALQVLQGLKFQLSEAQIEAKIPDFRHMVNIRLGETFASKAVSSILNFERTHEKAYLYVAKDTLEQANQYIPNTYTYFLNMAYVSIILDHDIESAKREIERCKGNKQNTDWKYSVAFLSAYQGHDPMSIYSKYQDAFSSSDYNAIQIVEYIECMIDEEPNRSSLHFAAGLVYEYCGDIKQMRRHFAAFLKEGKYDKRTEKLIARKMAAMHCNSKCNDDCYCCGDNLEE